MLQAEQALSLAKVGKWNALCIPTLMQQIEVLLKSDQCSRIILGEERGFVTYPDC